MTRTANPHSQTAANGSHKRNRHALAPRRYSANRGVSALPGGSKLQVQVQTPYDEACEEFSISGADGLISGDNALQCPFKLRNPYRFNDNDYPGCTLEHNSSFADLR